MAVLFLPLDHILGNRAKVSLLRALFYAQGELGVREAARLAQISHVAALKPLTELALMGIVHSRTAGRQHRYQLNDANLLFQPLKSLFDMEWRRLANIFESIEAMLATMPGIEGAYLIGSAVRGEDEPGSDLDLLVIVQKKTRTASLTESIAADALQLQHRFGLRVSPVVLSAPALASMHKQRDLFIMNALNDARIVVGPPLEDLLDGAQ